MNFLYRIRKLIYTVLLIGLPISIYLGFFRDEPLFEPAYDIDLGRQTVYSIASDTVEYPILPQKDYPEQYAYLKDMVKEITSSSEIKYAGLFKYDSLQIINRDDVLNAFCVPGGYIYVYSGLIKYLEHPDHLAGVLAHEIAHAELRHSATQMQQEYGRRNMLNFLYLSGGVNLSGAIRAKILKDLVDLDYSRGDEADADKHSVIYLKDTRFACNGCAGFFEKLIGEGQDFAIPEFLSDHPDSGARVTAVNGYARETGCSIDLEPTAAWEAFKAGFPETKEEEEGEAATDSLEVEKPAVQADSLKVEQTEVSTK